MTPRTILVVEDEYFLADDCALCVRKAGFDVAGPYGTLEEIPDLSGISGAVLDINLRGSWVYPLLDRLIAMNIPVTIYTGYSALPRKYDAVSRVMKPAHCSKAVDDLCRQIKVRSTQVTPPC
jgi:DNA-binding NtrC family response regulator